MNNKPSLRNCQFCKTNHDVDVTFSYREKECFVKCFHCGARGPSVRYADLCISGKDPIREMNFAIRLWEGISPTGNPREGY